MAAKVVAYEFGPLGLWTLHLTNDKLVRLPEDVSAKLDYLNWMLKTKSTAFEGSDVIDMRVPSGYMVTKRQPTITLDESPDTLDESPDRDADKGLKIYQQPAPQ